MHTLPVRVVTMTHAGLITSDGRTALLQDQDGQTRLWDLESGKPVGELPPDIFSAVTAMSDAAGLVLTGDNTGSVRVRELRSGRCLRTFRGHEGDVAAVRISADGRSGLSTGRDGTVRRWTLPHGGLHAQYRLSRPRLHSELNDLDAQTDLLLEAAREAICGDRREEALRLITRARSLPGQEYAPRARAAWRAAAEITRWTGPRAPRQELALSTVNTHLSIALSATHPIAALGGDNIQLWDLDTGSLLRSINGLPTRASAVALSGDGSRLCVATSDGELSLWSVSSGERLRQLEGRRTAGAHTAAFTEDGGLALVGGGDNRVVLWDLANAERLAVLGAHTFMVTSAWISPHGEIGATSGGDGLVRIWDLRSHTCLRVLRGHTSWTGSVCLSADLRFALSSGLYEDRTLRLWDLGTGACVRIFDELPEVANQVRFTPNGGFALSAGKDGTIRVWNVSTGRCVKVLEGHANEVFDLAVSSGGWRAASTGSDSTLRVWDLDWDLSAQ